MNFEVGNPFLPRLRVKPSLFQELCTLWQNAFIVKLLGKSIGFPTMKDHMIMEDKSGIQINGHG